MATPEKTLDTQAICESGYSCQFKDASIPDCFKCSSCQKVSRCPQLTICCSTHFCAQFLKLVADRGGNCPKCGNILSFIPCPNHHTILNFEVLCTMSNQGCDWEGVVRDLDKHKEMCEHAYIACPLQCGQQQIKRKSIEEHVRENCPEREHPCPYCGHKGTYRLITTAHLVECSHKPIACPSKCGVEGERAHMESHIQSCSLELVNCRFQRAGCDARFQRCQEEQHMKEYSQQHLELLVNTTVRMNKEIDALTAKNQFQEQQCEEMKKRIEDLMADQQEREEQMRQNKEEMAELQMLVSRLDSLEDQVSNMTNNTNMQNDISPPEHQGESERRVVELERRLEKRERELTMLQDELKKCVTESNTQYMQLHHRMKKLEESNLLPNVAPRSDDWAIQPPQDDWTTFTLENYSMLKKEEKEWSSPPFLAFDNGPELQVIVWPHGQGEGKGTHISVWLAQVSVDNYLHEYKVTLELQLIGQSGVCPNPHTVTEDFTVPCINRYVGHFSNKFMAHCDLIKGRPTQYLRDNSLKFQIMCTGICKADQLWD